MPDALVIEVKASRTTLIQELQGTGVRYIEAMLAHRGNDKVTRANGVADMFVSGRVWAPLRCRWAQELVEEMSAFATTRVTICMHDVGMWGGAAPHPVRRISPQH
jgi:predicted phage terminase large subunit-like protein